MSNAMGELTLFTDTATMRFKMTKEPKNMKTMKKSAMWRLASQRGC